MTFTSYVHGGYQEIPVIVTHTIVCKATSTILYSMISPSHDYRITNRDKHEWEQRSCFVFDFELLWLFKKCIPKLRDSIVLVFSPVLKTIFYKKKTNPQQNKKNMLWVVGAISVLFKSHSHKTCVKLKTNRANQDRIFNKPQKVAPWSWPSWWIKWEGK